MNIVKHNHNYQNQLTNRKHKLNVEHVQTTIQNHKQNVEQVQKQCENTINVSSICGKKQNHSQSVKRFADTPKS